MSTVTSETPHKRAISHIKKHQYPQFFHSQLHLSCFQTNCAPQPSLHASLPSQTGSHYRGSHPITDGHLTHRWQLQMNQEQQPLDQTRPTLHKCLSLTHLLCWDGRCTSTLARILLNLFISICLSRHFKFSLVDFARLCSCSGMLFTTFIFPHTLLNKEHLAWFWRNRYSLDENFSFVYFLFHIFYFCSWSREKS